jgi:hypothetical protein
MALSAKTSATIPSAPSVTLPSSTVTSGHFCRAVSSFVDSIRSLDLVVGSCHSSPKDKKTKKIQNQKDTIKVILPLQ